MQYTKRETLDELFNSFISAQPTTIDLSFK